MMAENLDWAAVDAQIEWLRSTTSGTIVEETLAALKAGVDEAVLWAAGALTATHYINNQAHNLLGFVSHALIGCEDARRLAQGKEPRIRHLLLVQALHQVVFDMHEPSMSPFILLPCSPLKAETTEQNIALLWADVRIGEYSRGDHRFNALARALTREALIDLLLDIGLSGITTDEHTLITPSLALGMVEFMGWERGFDMLRCALRYIASFAHDRAAYEQAVALAEHYGIAKGAATSGLQPDRIQALRQAFHEAQPDGRPGIAANALADEGVSPETVLAAVSLVACDFYLMADPVPHDDFDAISREVAPVHIGTGTNALRSMLPAMSPPTQVLAAVLGGSLLQRGPATLNESFEFVPFAPARAYPYTEDVQPLVGQSSAQLLETLKSALYAHDYQESTAAVQAYAESGAAAATLIAALTAVACTDDGTLMHNIKHLHSMVEEFEACPHSDRWQFLIAAARFMAWYAGKNQDVYDRAMAVLLE
jgi:hypothetical protein